MLLCVFFFKEKKVMQDSGFWSGSCASSFHLWASVLCAQWVDVAEQFGLLLLP